MHYHRTDLQRSPRSLNRPFRLLAWVFVGLILAFSLALYPWVPSHATNSTTNSTTPLAPSNSGSLEALLREGIEQFESRDFEGAIATWKQALDAAVHPSEQLTRALIFSNLSLAHQHLGEWSDATRALSESLAIFDLPEEGNTLSEVGLRHRSPLEWDYYAKVLNTQGWLHWRQGQPQDAFTVWQATAHAYEAANNISGLMGSQINQAKVLQFLGLSDQARKRLEAVERILAQYDDNIRLKATGLRHLGNALRRVGDLDQSATVLEQAIAILQSQELSDVRSPQCLNHSCQEALSATRLELGNTKRAQWHHAVALTLDDIEQHRTAALTHYQDAAASAPTLLPQLQANANLMALRVNIEVQASHSDRSNANTPNNNRPPINSLSSEERAENYQHILTLWDEFQSIFANPEWTELLMSRAGLDIRLNVINSIIKFRRMGMPVAGISLAGLPATGITPKAVHKSMSWDAIALQLKQTIEMAHYLQDKRSESLALGYLGHVYESVSQARVAQQHVPQWQDAKVLTDKAIALAETIQAPDLQYRWEWQLGRILQQQKHRQNTVTCYQTIAENNSDQSDQLDQKGVAILYKDDVLCAYERAVQQLDEVRKDLLFVDSDVQFSFRDNVEPLYRQYVDLLLRDLHPSKERLAKATELIDALQLAELENYLGCNIDPVQLSQKTVDPTAAIFYPIILGDPSLGQESQRLEVILQMPDQTLHRATVPISGQEFETITSRLYNNLPNPSRERANKQDAGVLYDLLIQPFESVLTTPLKTTPETTSPSENQNFIETLVFVLDGSLRNVPMAVLWDGDHYLLEKYAIAIAPSLQVVEPNPLSYPINILAAGSSEALDHPFKPRSFPPLLNVQQELESISDLASLERSRLSTDILLNKAFTQPNLERQLQRDNYSVVHLASHGVFSSDPKRTFIALPDPDQEEDTNPEKYAIFPDELDALLRTRDSENEVVELLVLSACETATGDNRAALGLAGLTVRSGARSTLATLWPVDDESAAIVMKEFYRQLMQNPGIRRAEALRRAQIYLWDTALGQQQRWHRPYFWSPYILVGNWL